MSPVGPSSTGCFRGITWWNWFQNLEKMRKNENSETHGIVSKTDWVEAKTVKHGVVTHVHLECEDCIDINIIK